jgi:hypothetical protein
MPAWRAISRSSSGLLKPAAHDFVLVQQTDPESFPGCRISTGVKRLVDANISLLEPPFQ